MLKGLASKWLSPTFLSSAISLSTSQPSSRSFHTLAFYDYGDGYNIAYILDVRPKVFDVCDKVVVCGSIQELVRKSETSNLSEVCSGSDCHDNNMGTLTKWDTNTAQNNFNYCIFGLPLSRKSIF